MSRKHKNKKKQYYYPQPSRTQSSESNNVVIPLKESAVKLFVRNKLVELSNVLYDVFSAIFSKKTAIVIGSIGLGYLVLCGIGYLIFLTPIVDKQATIPLFEYPMVALFIMGGIIFTLMILGIAVFCIAQLYTIIHKFIKNNVILAKNGVKVKSKWATKVS